MNRKKNLGEKKENKYNKKFDRGKLIIIEIFFEIFTFNWDYKVN